VQGGQHGGAVGRRLGALLSLALALHLGRLVDGFLDKPDAHQVNHAVFDDTGGGAPADTQELLPSGELAGKFQIHLPIWSRGGRGGWHGT
jgi:hypothetical protein